MNYYEILGINPSVTTTDVKQAYRNKAKDYHPDKLINIPDAVRKLAEEELKKINQAYNTLNDSALREAYDIENGFKEAQQQETPTYKSPEKLELIRQINVLRASGSLGELNSAAKTAKDLYNLDRNDSDSRELYAQALSHYARTLADENQIDEAIRLLKASVKITQNQGAKDAIIGLIEKLKPQGKLSAFSYSYATLSLRTKNIDVLGFLDTLKLNHLNNQELWISVTSGFGKSYPVDFAWSDNPIIPPIEMAFIEGGSFIMGSPLDEIGHEPSEEPQHRVIVPSFYMSKYPIARIHWNAIARLPKINKGFSRSFWNNDSGLMGVKGDYANGPVPTSWDKAKEFCDRLSKQTGLSFRLPSEAEWEYACRGGTSTPFHFGRHGSSDIANYKNEPYGCDVSGSNDFKKNGYQYSNQLGLYFMHGNIAEWCLDDWHDNYNSAPADGSAWVDRNNSGSKVLRGARQLDFSPKVCRSASRYNGSNAVAGFRIVCQTI
jgi:tetratricopeptide (TPR) repeat protein